MSATADTGFAYQRRSWPGQLEEQGREANHRQGYQDHHGGDGNLHQASGTRVSHPTLQRRPQVSSCETSRQSEAHRQCLEDAMTDTPDRHGSSRWSLESPLPASTRNSVRGDGWPPPAGRYQTSTGDANASPATARMWDARRASPGQLRTMVSASCRRASSCPSVGRAPGRVAVTRRYASVRGHP